MASRYAIVDSLLRRFLARYGARQVFVFGSTGEPFRAGRLPVEREELVGLQHALDLIEQMEAAARPKPFFARDVENDLLVAALEEKEDIYVVVLGASDDGEPLEARVALLRAELVPYVGSLRGWLNPPSAGN